MKGILEQFSFIDQHDEYSGKKTSRAENCQYRADVTMSHDNHMRRRGVGYSRLPYGKAQPALIEEQKHQPEVKDPVPECQPGDYQFDKRYEPSKPYVYINMYNNHWRTNFVAWIGNGERMSSRVRIWSFDKFSSESALYTPSMEARIPLKVGRSRSNPGTLPITQSGISLSRKGVALTAFGPNPDGQGTILRVWEQAGLTEDLEITMPAGSKFLNATPVSLRGETLAKPLKIKDGKFSYNLHAYRPVSFVLTM